MAGGRRRDREKRMGSDRRRSRWVVESTEEEEEERFALRICACWSIEIRRPWLTIETLRGGDKEKERVMRS